MASVRNGDSRLTRLAYGLPALPLAVMGIPMYIFLPGFYSERLGLAGVGTILLVARLWDVVTDPVIGSLGDRLDTRFGRRRLLMLIGTPILLISAWQLFRPPTDVGLAYLLGWGLVAYLGWTLIQLPYTAWGAELSTDYDRRSGITASREGFMLVGTLFAIIWPALMGTGRADAATLASLAWVLVIMMPLCLGLTFWRVPEAPGQTEPIGWRQGWRLLSRNKPFMRLMAAYVLNGMANGLPAAVFLLFVAHVIEARDWTGVLLLAYFFSGIVALPGWLWLSKHLGKHRSWSLSMLWASLVFVFVPFLGAGDVYPYLAICILSGASVAADMALPAAIQADLVDLDTSEGGGGRTGLFFGLWNMATKLSLALAVGIGFPALELAGFRPDQPDSGNTMALALAYGAVPIVFKLAATAIVWNFPIDRAAHTAIRERMARSGSA